jgi:hypothetical protein
MRRWDRGGARVSPVPINGAGLSPEAKRGGDVSAPEHVRQFLEKLVGQPATLPTPLPEMALQALEPGGAGLGYSQLNELLLLLGFDRVTRSFFQFLKDGATDYEDGTAISDLAELEAAVDRFRKLGLLLFGNVKYAFKVMSRDAEQLADTVARLQPIPPENFAHRHDPIRPIEKISADQTYYLGYVIERELRDRLKEDPLDEEAVREETARQGVVGIGKLNQEAYLASDHLDVYVATSMRQRHEFLAVSRLTAAIFGHSTLVDLKLRWFDPTQAYCRDRIDKGLSEALMLRRAQCTIYLAQETDTLGKDSELASTLAQGKPVIAFVPAVDSDSTDQLLSELREIHPSSDVRELMLGQLQVFDPAAAWTDGVVRGWMDSPLAAPVEALKERLHRAIVKHYDGRAKTLRETHPLGIQVNLATGVANGVLVVRTVEDCATLVRNIVTRSLQFRVEEVEGTALLRECVSGCVFRVATGDVMLTNAFWNFYLEPSQ